MSMKPLVMSWPKLKYFSTSARLFTGIKPQKSQPKNISFKTYNKNHNENNNGDINNNNKI